MTPPTERCSLRGSRRISADRNIIRDTHKSRQTGNHSPSSEKLQGVCGLQHNKPQTRLFCRKDDSPVTGIVLERSSHRYEKTTKNHHISSHVSDPSRFYIRMLVLQEVGDKILRGQTDPQGGHPFTAEFTSGLNRYRFDVIADLYSTRISPYHPRVSNLRS